MKNKEIFTRVLYNYHNQMNRKSPFFSPTFESEIYEINKELSKDNHYSKRIKEIQKTRNVHEKGENFSNVSVDFSWINMKFDTLKELLNKFPNDIAEKVKRMEEKALEYKIDISENVNNIHQIISEMVNSSEMNEIKLEIERQQADYYKASFYYQEAIKAFNTFGRLADPLLDELYINKFSKQIRNTSIDDNPHLNGVLKSINYLNEKGYFSSNEKIFDINLIQSYFDRLNHESLIIFKNLRNNGFTHKKADVYTDHLKNKQNGVAAFLTEKTNDNLEHPRITDIEGSSYKKILVFQDYSFIVEDNFGKLIEFNSANEVKDFRTILLKQTIADIFDKNPHYSKMFFNLTKEIDDLSSNNFFNSILTFKENMIILKNNSYDYFNDYKEQISIEPKKALYKIFEAIDDNMHKILKNHKIKQYADSISSSKYSNLYDDNTYKIMEGLYDLKVSKQDLQDYVGKKLAAYKTTELLNDALKQLLASFNDFSPDAVIKKAEHSGAEVLLSSDDMVILKIFSFDQSKALGSNSWCISRDKSYFNSYTSKNKEQYFVYDFNYESTQIESMIGVTLDNGNYSAAHFKNDEAVEEDESYDLDEIVDLINDLEMEKEKKLENNKKLNLNP